MSMALEELDSPVPMIHGALRTREYLGEIATICENTSAYEQGMQMD